MKSNTQQTFINRFVGQWKTRHDKPGTVITDDTINAVAVCFILYYTITEGVMKILNEKHK